MPETDLDMVNKEWLQAQLRSNWKDLIILDCRSSNEYMEGHIRSAVNLSIPTIILRRLAGGKIDLMSTIKCRELKQRIQSGYNKKTFVLYCDVNLAWGNGSSEMAVSTTLNSNDGHSSNNSGTVEGGGGGAQQTNTGQLTISNLNNVSSDPTHTSTINMLHRRLKQDGCHVVCLQDGFSSFRDAFPEWCEENSQNQEMESSRGTTQTDQLMGLRSLRISTPHSDSACSSSAESSDCESTTHHQANEAPVEIVPGLYLGNASHSEDSGALQRYNIKYVLNVTPDLPNVFEASGGIQYLKIPITDHFSQDVATHFPSAIRFIDEARANGASVLVHCLAGVSRSVTVTLAYLMQTKSLCLNDAFSLVRDRKPDIAPNFHFMQQLHHFEEQLNNSPNKTLVPNQLTSHEFPPTTGVSPDSGIEFDRWTPSESGVN